MTDSNIEQRIKKTITPMTIMEPVVRDVEMWFSSDGTGFPTKQEAVKHEDALLKKSTFKERFHVTEIEGKQYFFLSEQRAVMEVLSEIKDYFKATGFSSYDMKAGWYSVEVDNSGDYTYVWFESLGKGIEDTRKLLNDRLAIEEQLNKTLLPPEPVSMEIPQSSVDAMNHAHALRFGEKL